jgi:hypothetical protein
VEAETALCPSLHFSAAPWPVAAPLQAQWQHLREAPAPASTDSAVAGEADAWFGNDAPALYNNRLAWRALSATEAEVDWRAEYDDWHTRQPERLHYRGRARLVRA